MADKSIPRIEGILQYYTKPLGKYYNAYRNHVYRTYHLTLLVYDQDLNIEKQEALAIAVAFHDMGVWTHHTMDYLNPSIDLAVHYMEENGILDHELVIQMINHHHQLTPFKSSKLVEAFRKADLIDLSFGIIGFGLPNSFYANLKEDFPFIKFHRIIFSKVISHAVSHIWNPFPMMKV